MLGNGWYNPLLMKIFGRWNLREILTIGKPKVIAQLKISYTDGSAEMINTDENWKTAEGPVIRNKFYLGEWYDARIEKEGWTAASFSDQQWKNAIKAEAPEGKLTWQYIPPARHTKTVYPQRIHSPKTGLHVVDMGQNFAGIIRFKANAPKGTEIIFRYAELVYPDGTLDFRTTAATQIKEGGIKGL